MKWIERFIERLKVKKKVKIDDEDFFLYYRVGEHINNMQVILNKDRTNLVSIGMDEPSLKYGFYKVTDVSWINDTLNMTKEEMFLLNTEDPRLLQSWGEVLNSNGVIII